MTEDYKDAMGYFVRLAADDNYDPRRAIKHLIDRIEPIFNAKIGSGYEIIDRTLRIFNDTLEEFRSAEEALNRAQIEQQKIVSLKDKIAQAQESGVRNLDELIAELEASLEILTENEENLSKFEAVEKRFAKLSGFMPTVQDLAKHLDEHQFLIRGMRADEKRFRRQRQIMKLLFWLVNLTLAAMIEFVVTSFTESALQVVFPTYARIGTFFFIYLIQYYILDPFVENRERLSYHKLMVKILIKLDSVFKELDRITGRLSDILSQITV